MSKRTSPTMYSTQELLNLIRVHCKPDEVKRLRDAIQEKTQAMLAKNLGFNESTIGWVAQDACKESLFFQGSICAEESTMNYTRVHVDAFRRLGTATTAVEARAYLGDELLVKIKHASSVALNDFRMSA